MFGLLYSILFVCFIILMIYDVNLISHICNKEEIKSAVNLKLENVVTPVKAERLRELLLDTGYNREKVL